jgi:Protein of unknown function (DUF1559)
MIHIACACGRQLQAPDELVGREARCAACGMEQIIPDGRATVDEPVSFLRREAPSFQPNVAAEVDEPQRSEPYTTNSKAILSLALGIGALALTSLAILGSAVSRNFPVIKAVAALCFITCGLAVIFGSVAFGEIDRSRVRLRGRGLAAWGLVAGMLSLTLLAASGISGMFDGPCCRAPRTQLWNNLRQISLAMNTYCQHVGNGLPPAAGGKNLHPNLSWRVAILPYMEEEDLYGQFHLDEPWDSPHNKELLTRMPNVYQIPEAWDSPGMTHYRVFVGNRAAFEMPDPRKPVLVGRKPEDFRKGTGKTILVATAAEAVPWTKPDELPYDPGQPLPQLGNYFGGCQVAMGDASVRCLNADISEAVLRAMIDLDGDKSLIDR